MENHTEIIKIKDYIIRIRVSKTTTESSRILLLLHGHLGNEDSMWILTRPIPESYTILSPRAPLQTGDNQYSWHKITPKWPEIDFYRDLTTDLVNLVHHWMKSNDFVIEPFDVMGFSQGAVMAYALALLQTDQIRNIAALSGFIPLSWKEHCDRAKFAGKKFFIAHGTDDEMVPYTSAQQTVQWLTNNNAKVTFCEADIGHKISADCLKELGDFFS